MGGEIAVELARLRSGTMGGRRGNTTARPPTAATTRRASDRKGGVVVLGGSVLDFTAKITSPQILVSLDDYINMPYSIPPLPFPSLRRMELTQAVWEFHLEVLVVTLPSACHVLGELPC